MLVYAERLPSSPAELSAAVRIAAKFAEKLEADVDDYFAALRAVGFDDGQIIEIALKSALTQGNHHRLMPNGRFCAANSGHSATA